VDRQTEIRESDVCVVGMACRFPGAPTVEKFWQNLQERREATTFFSDEELLAEGVDPGLLRDPCYVKAGQILPDIDLFDADLFKITSDEAEILDPQQRQFLECVVEALENAGYDPEIFPGSIGVYAGVGMNTYLLRNLSERYREASPLDRYRLMLAADKDFLATRVSYKLNLRGPSVNVNTACSTSLVAVHMACLSLLSGECDMVLAGSAHIKVPQVEGYLFQEGMIFSRDGRCRAFDAKAQGTILGNGVGVVLLKRLQDAVADGDWIHAVIKGTSINNDGSRKASYTAPSVEGQAAAIAEAQMLAGCGADTISYVEAHGTGTALGDPVEVAALRRAFSRGTTRRGYCGIGSVKTNIGHLDAAAGIAGLIKTCLMLQHKCMVPSLHFEELNPEIDLECSPFYVNTALKKWEADGTPRRAGVSSFGIGGTNAHVILEESPARQPAPSKRACQLLVVSARSPKALDKTADELARYLRQHRELDVADVAYTLALGRRPYAHRLALTCRDHREAALTLTLGDEDRVLKGLVGDKPCKVTFVFNDSLLDNGARAADLYEVLPAFRKAVDHAVGALGTEAAYAAASQLRAGDAVASLIGQYALAQLWMSWNVRPSSVIGFGAGELVAACVAGRFPIAVALDVARRRSAGKPARDFSPVASQLPFWSNSAGRWIDSGEVTHQALWARPAVGMDPDSCVSRLLEGTGQIPLAVEPTDEKAAGSGLEALLRSVGQLWTNGVEINWSAVYADERRSRVPLPVRPFERKRYWVAPADRPDPASHARRAKLRWQVEAAEGNARVQRVMDFIQGEIARVLGTGTNPLPDADTNLFDFGIDSLILIEIAARLTNEMDHAVSPSAFVDHYTIRAFATNLIASLGYRHGPGKATAA
jgi:phthiocerol/phenolphthiocerol synthesis type-I polyketide synthase E